MKLKTVRSKSMFDESWSFHKGEIRIPYAVKGGMTGGITDASSLKEGSGWISLLTIKGWANSSLNGVL